MPEQHRISEVIAGPVSKVQNIKIGQPAFPVPDPDLDQKAIGVVSGYLPPSSQ